MSIKEKKEKLPCQCERPIIFGEIHARKIEVETIVDKCPQCGEERTVGWIGKQA